MGVTNYDILQANSFLGPVVNSSGNVYFVDSGTGNDGNDGKTWTTALATVDAAINKCTANNGDVILIAPGHAETIDAATDLVPDVAGVSIVGLGKGADRPTFTFSTNNAANIPVSGNSTYIANILCVCNKDGMTAGITISGTDVTLKDVEWRDVTDKEATLAVLTTSAADRLTIDGFFHNGFTTGDACTDAIRLVGVDSGVIKNSRFLGNYGTAIIEFHTTACTKINIDNCVFLETGTTDLSKNVVDTVTGSTWSVTGYDLAAGCSFSGGSGASVAKDDVSAVSSALATLQAEFSGTAGIASFPAAAAPANNVSAVEVLRDVWDALRNGTGGLEPGTNRSIINEIRGAALNFNGCNYLGVTTDMSSATWNTAASHEVFTVTGCVRMRILVECLSTLTDAGDAADIQFGVEGATNAFIASTNAAGKGGNEIAGGEIWCDATPTETYGNFSSLMLDKIVNNGLDVGYEITGAALTGGSLLFHCWWEPLNTSGAVVAGAGGTL